MERQRARKVNNKGAFTIPKDVRDSLGLSDKYIDIAVTKEGNILLTPYERICGFCGEIINTPKRLYRQKYICDKCNEDLKIIIR